MDRRRLHELLRLRADCLRVPEAIIERALSRAARADPRPLRTSGPLSAASRPNLATPLPIPVAAISPPTVPSLGGAASGSPVTVASLGIAPVDGAPPAAPVPRGQLPPGRIIAGYRIESLLGKGGMGSVYRAHQLSMDRPIAFKVLSSRLAEDPTFVGRFKREARAAGRLHHHNLITVHEAGEADGMVFFSMELVEGHSLKDVLKERGRIPPAEALPLVRQVLEALAYAHGRGVIHRDIKPDNIMVTSGGKVKIADLGLSRIEDPHNEEGTDLFKTSVGSFMGTPHYMAPEQGRDAHTADARADLYALGATLYHLICGHPPFEGASPMEVLMAAQNNPLAFSDPPPAKNVRDFIARLMEKDPARRPADATAALVLLDRLLAPPPPAKPRPSPRRRLASALAWVGSIALAVLLILFALGVVKERERARQWRADLAAAEAEASGLHFAEALDRLGRARAALGDHSQRAEACDRAIAAITAAWDDWALTRLADSERSLRNQLRDRRYADARETLRKIPDPWRSPAAERRLDELQAEWEAAVAKDAELARTATVQPEQHEKKRRAINEWLQRAAITPTDAARIDGGALLLTSTGGGRLPMPQSERPLLMGVGMELRLAWRNAGSDPQARWELELGPDALVVSTPAGSELRLAQRTIALPVGADGWPVIALWRRGPLWTIETRSPDGRRVPVTLRPTGNELPMRWQLGNGELAVHLSPRGR
jgi:tetratricopeptide (TPR) repeat protein